MGILLRPHGQNSKDTMTTPFGQVITKQQYWLNSSEVERVIGNIKEASNKDVE
jgi:hypothetical protein